jgi:hypothetical protein
MKRKVKWGLNLINLSDRGTGAPFVYRDSEGIHVGDIYNHHIFHTVGEALRYLKRVYQDIDIQIEVLESLE